MLVNFNFFNSLDKPYGQTYGSWTVKWWQWAMSIPTEINPVNDQTGKNASLNQPEKDVWFLAGTWATEKLLNVPNRKVTIPSDRAILFPVINCEANPIEYPYLKTDDDIINHVIQDENTIVSKEAYINNTAVPIQRVPSDPSLFSLRLFDKNDNNKYIDTPASADGYWVFLKPLPKGKYEIQFGGKCESGRLCTSVNYEISIQ
jgi:hypothetical protein